MNLEPKLRPDDLVSIEAAVPDESRTERLDMKSPQRDWYRLREESLTQGDLWIRNATSVALYVPSAATQGEWNVLLDPGHPDFATLKFQKPKPFQFDLRMFR